MAKLGLGAAIYRDHIGAINGSGWHYRGLSLSPKAQDLFWHMLILDIDTEGQLSLMPLPREPKIKRLKILSIAS